MIGRELSQGTERESQMPRRGVVEAASSPATLARSRTLLGGAAITGILIAALALRLYNIGAHGLWYDELASIETAQRGVSAIFTDRFGWIANQTTAHYLLVWLMSLFADPAQNPLFVRLPSILAGTGTCLVGYGIGRESFGRGQGILASALLALSPTLLVYSQDTRPYAMLAFLTALSVYCLLRAEDTGSKGWWAAFTLATLANLYNSYMALTLVLPALAPYLAWVLLRLRVARRENPRALVAAVLSLGVLLAACVPLLLDLSRVPRNSPQLSEVSLLSPVSAMLELTSWLTRLGLAGSTDRLFQTVLAMLAITGVYGGVRAGGAARRCAALCGLLLIVPSTILVVLGTSTAVFQRYALFCLPVYVLLVANGVLWPVSLIARAPTGSRGAVVSGIVGGAACAILIAIFGVGAFGFSTPEGHASFALGPDYRSAAAYVQSHAKADDVVLYVDDPAHGIVVGDYYWKDKRPANAYDARDPRVGGLTPAGDLYWVITSIRGDALLLDTIADPSRRIEQVARYENIAVFRESRPGSLLDSLDAMASTLNRLQPNSQPILTLLASIYQDKGQVDKAVETYRAAGTYFPLGAEHLRTAIGMASIGDQRRAWQEALLSKFVQPDHPEVHIWLSERLKAQGYEAQSRIEQMIADSLKQSAGSRPVGKSN